MKHIGAWQRLDVRQRWMIVLLIAAILLANVAQPYPALAPLQHGPTLLVAIMAPWLLARWPLSTRSVTCLWLFLLLHTFAARWIYSYVPYDAWLRVLTGHDLASTFGWTRNGFDRLVHFAFGALFTVPFAEATVRFGGLTRRWALTFAFAAIGLGSALYEIFEWLLTVIAAGDTADFYNGQQGDMWDAQKDMLAAQIGSALALVVFRIGSRLGADGPISAQPEHVQQKE